MQPAAVPDRVIVKIVLTAAVAVACVGFGVVGVRPQPSYFLVEDLSASGLRAHEGEDLRVHGFVVAGTIAQHLADPSTHSFMLASRGVALRVVLHGALPDTFKDQSEAVVTGRLVQRDGHWTLEGDEVMTKCGGKYEGTPRDLSAIAKFK
jgi:cytochrome c-type biogenesis protein CcmE